MNILFDDPIRKHDAIHADRVVAILNAHVKLVGRLIHDLGADQFDPQALRHRLDEIEEHFKEGRKIA
ncbi:MAG: hypothetical protein A2902_03575 [Elusimicrobia bacterium RIFCSPLOWO2_01_FULL_64_13]|nr:MAG: hypothetical protein A2636_05645 [Elusimicrobia bacterium RIFCSPHIGHO2_01_FULL_64_10]OGR97176.1 MAG: hypothetical protein A2902_03575 [Elusimicrobia bacterium RIFCSPLOWO2_01_FULL_64_13]